MGGDPFFEEGLFQGEKRLYSGKVAKPISGKTEDHDTKVSVVLENRRGMGNSKYVRKACPGPAKKKGADRAEGTLDGRGEEPPTNT